MFWMNALVFFFLGRTRRDLVAAAVAAAGLLLTKANGAFILVALVLASLTDVSAMDRESRRRSWLALAAGVGIAVVVFAILASHDPGEFMKGWIATTRGVPVRPGNGPGVVPAVFRVGFIVIDPNFGFRILRVLSTDAPFGVVLGAAGAIKALFERRATLIGWWFFLGLAALIVQAVWLENHLAVVYPAMALGSAWFLAENGPDRHGSAALRRALDVGVSRPCICAGVQCGPLRRRCRDHQGAVAGDGPVARPAHPTV